MNCSLSLQRTYKLSCNQVFTRRFESTDHERDRLPQSTNTYVLYLIKNNKPVLTRDVGIWDTDLQLAIQLVSSTNTHEPRATKALVQSLNSPFFPPPVGAAPRWAKRESRITSMRMLRTPPFFPPNRGKTIFGRTFQIWLLGRFSR